MSEPRGMTLQTPLGSDALFLTSFRGREGISQLYHYQLEMMADNRTEIAFDKIIGQKVSFTITLPDGSSKRHWSGICSSLTQDGRDATFTRFRMEVVPMFWLLTRRTQCRIFQYQSVPDILKAVLTGLDAKFEIQGTFEPRDYCVQYRETDFDFASRLMEEEGIYYYFKFTEGNHQLIVANSPQSHVPVPFAEKAIFEELEGGNRPDMRVTRWEKSQELRSGKVTLWDHHFELPHQHLDAERPTMESVAIGKVTHKLKLPANDALELFDYPGAYAQRFDGVDRGGGDNAGDLSKIFQDNKRTAAIRMEQEAVQAITIRGAGNCRQFTAGHKFTLERHYNADGAYVLTTVEHSATAGANLRSGAGEAVSYTNHFTCIPLALPFRPAQTVEKPYIPGPQTAVVTGPPGEKIFCDKYGRLKVQFHWDRKGKKDANSSCWVRASQNWGGASWGGMFIPHVGQEVIVEFEEGDPDRPLITGRVYNAECMPPLKLPDNKTQSIIQDHGGNQIKLQGDKGKEQIKMSSPFGNTVFAIGAPGSPGNGIEAFTDLFFTITVGEDWKKKVLGNSKTHIKGNKDTLIQGNVTEMLEGTKDTSILGHKIEKIMNSENKKVVGTSTSYIIGMETKTNIAVKNDIVIALNNKLTKGGLIDINNAKEIRKCPTVQDAIKYSFYKELKKETESNDFKQKVSGVMKQKIGTLETKIAKLKEEIDALTWVVGDLSMEAKDQLKAMAGEMVLDSKGQMKMMASLCNINGVAKFSK